MIIVHVIENLEFNNVASGFRESGSANTFVLVKVLTKAEALTKTKEREGGREWGQTGRLDFEVENFKNFLQYEQISPRTKIRSVY